VTETVENYQGDGTPSADYPDQNVTTETTYTPDDQVATSTAVNPATGNQVTQYVYGTTLSDSGVASSDLLRAVIYPDSTNTYTMSGGVPTFSDGSGGYDRVEYQYDRLGEETQVEDQNGTVHDYYFDELGRQTEDVVTALGTGIDGSVRRIDTAYEVRGMVDETTSYSSTSGGSANIVDQVFEQYNDWGMLAREYQKDTPGPIALDADGNATDGTPAVSYGYSDGQNPTRLTSMTYPNGRVLTYGYNSGDDAALGRVSYLADSDGTHLADYTYLGLDQITGVSSPEPGVTTSVTPGQFGQTQNVTATQTTTDTALVDLSYTYDQAGNLTYRQDVVAGSSNNLDEQYTYDGMYQLSTMQRGYLDTSGQTPVFTASTAGLSQSWTLDATGNVASVTTDGTIQDRTANAANQITGFSDATATPVYDAAGNMITTPQPDDASAAFNCTYDAWNRLVKVTTGSGEGETTVAEYQYDGLGRRVTATTYAAGVPTVTHFYLSQDDQVLEERAGTSTSASRQYVWGLRYVDDLVLRDDNSSSGDLGVDNSGLGRRLYAIQDANWNVVAVADAAGAVQERYTYTAYGQVEVRNADFSLKTGGTTLAWTVLYTGHSLDAETGLYYCRARYYSAYLATFLVPDPISYKGGMNLYEYTDDSPLTHTDPSGLKIATIAVVYHFDTLKMNDAIKDEVRRILAECMKAHGNPADTLNVVFIPVSSTTFKDLGYTYFTNTGNTSVRVAVKDDMSLGTIAGQSAGWIGSISVAGMRYWVDAKGLDLNKSIAAEIVHEAMYHPFGGPLICAHDTDTGYIDSASAEVGGNLSDCACCRILKYLGIAK
jgi:RHS repeat-associated protein